MLYMYPVLNTESDGVRVQAGFDQLCSVEATLRGPFKAAPVQAGLRGTQYRAVTVILFDLHIRLKILIMPYRSLTSVFPSGIPSSLLAFAGWRA
jgi:hypothetical protein